MWPKLWMMILIGGGAASCLFLGYAGVERLRMIRKQSRPAERLGSALLGGAVIAGAGYGLFLLTRYLLGRPDWLVG